MSQQEEDLVRRLRAHHASAPTIDLAPSVVIDAARRRRRTTRATTVLGGTLTCLAVVAGLAWAAPNLSPVPTVEPVATASTPAETGPVGLVDLWRVTDAPGLPADTWIRIDAGSFRLFADCGHYGGSWDATDVLFLAHVSSHDARCPEDPPTPTPEWIESVATYHPVADGWELRDAHGDPVATLTVDGAPPLTGPLAERHGTPPQVTDDVRARLRPPAPLPDGAQPATAQDLPGRWVPAGRSYPTDPHVLFDARGFYTGSDGCNHGFGRWTVDPTGQLVTAPGGGTAMWCEGEQVPLMVATAARAIMEGEQLVLLDHDGTETGRLERATNDPARG